MTHEEFLNNIRIGSIVRYPKDGSDPSYTGIVIEISNTQYSRKGEPYKTITVIKPDHKSVKWPSKRLKLVG